jgi:hypothetical protein
VIATGSAPLPDVGSEILVNPIVLIGLALLVVYVSCRAYGRELLPRGPSPETRARIADAMALLFVSVLLQVLLGAAARDMGIESEALVALVAFSGPVAVLVVAWRLYLSGRPRGPWARGLPAGCLAWLATMPLVASVLWT